MLAECYYVRMARGGWRNTEKTHTEFNSRGFEISKRPIPPPVQMPMYPNAGDSLDGLVIEFDERVASWELLVPARDEEL